MVNSLQKFLFLKSLVGGVIVLHKEWITLSMSRMKAGVKDFRSELKTGIDKSSLCELVGEGSLGERCV